MVRRTAGPAPVITNPLKLQIGKT